MDCCPERLNPFNIHIGNSYQVSENPKCGGYYHIALNQPSISVSCPGMMGRYVGVRLPGHSRVLTLCEVQIYTETDSPQFLTCSAAACTSLSISWVKPRAPLIGYRVNYIIVNDSPSDVISTDFGPENEEQVLRDVLADREYSITLVAVGIYKESLPVEVTCATMTPPPEDLRVKDITETSITVSWIQRTTSLAIGYRMWIGRSDTTGSLFTQFVPTNQTDLTLMDLSPGTEYVISATSINRYNEGPAMDVTVVTKTDSPQFLTCSAATYYSLTISWVKPRAPLIGYRVNCTLVSDSPADVYLTDAGLENEEQVLLHVLADREYSVTLVAVGMYEKSLPVGVTCGTMTPPPEDFRVKDITETSITVSWIQRTNSLAIGHRMWIGQSDTTESLFTQFVPTDQTDLTFSDLSPATEYVISAASINRHNEGPAVNIAVVTQTPSPTALYVEQKTTNTVTISWLPSKAVITTYNITYTGNGRSTSVMEPGDVDSCKLTGLVPGSQYDIDLVAVSRFGRSLAVSTSVITDTDPPSRLNVAKSSTTWLFLEWTSPVANILSFDLEISDELGSTRTFLRLEGHTTSYNVTDLVPETTYVFKMGAFSKYGRSVDITYSNSTVTSPGRSTEPPRISLTSTPALVQTVSEAIDVLPKQKMQTASGSDNTLESDLIDTSATDLSPRQQLKVLKEKKKEKEDMKPTVQILSREDYALSMSAVGCSSWNDDTNQWGLEDCDADINLEDGVISCRCPMTEWKVFVGTMTLPLPNSIYFINAFKNFLHLSDNSVVFSIVVSEFILYLLLMVLLCVDFHQVRALRRPFTRRVSPITGASGGAKNQSEPLCKVSLVPPDRMVARHVYQLTVTTGSMFGAGTTSRIGFQLFGSEAKSPVKMLNPKGEALLRGSTLHFVMPVRESLGEVLLLRIWHDNSGEGDTASWFLGSFVVRDMETGVVSYFTCNDWLSPEKGDCEVQKVIHASTEEELTSFTNVFNEATRDVFYDKQLWASALVAAPGSLFTKAQRLSCCFTLLNTMMLSSAMWYKAENTTADTRVLNLGFVRFTIQIFVLAVGLAAIFSLPFLTKPQVILKEDLQLNLWNSTAPKKVYPTAISDVKSVRKKKELNEKSASVLKEFILLFIFVVLLFYIAQADKDQHAFDETQSLANNILQEYDAIKTPDQFYAWTEDVLLPTLYPATWYNGRDMKYLDRQFAHNTGSFRLGPPRLIQVRQLPGDLGFERFVDLQTAAWWDACFKHILGLVVFINTISLLRVVRFSQTIGKLLALPGIMKEELLSFLVVAAIAFIAFISSAHLIFGSHMESYADLYHTTFALFEMMLGRFFAKDMLDSNPVTGPIFFSSFMICIFILLINFLTTIICDAISTDVDVSHDQELGEYIWRRFLAMLGFHSTPDKENKQGELMMKGFEANIVIIQEKLDEGLDICNSILPEAGDTVQLSRHAEPSTRRFRTSQALHAVSDHLVAFTGAVNSLYRTLGPLPTLILFPPESPAMPATRSQRRSGGGAADDPPPAVTTVSRKQPKKPKKPTAAGQIKDIQAQLSALTSVTETLQQSLATIAARPPAPPAPPHPTLPPAPHPTLPPAHLENLQPPPTDSLVSNILGTGGTDISASKTTSPAPVLSPTVTYTSPTTSPPSTSPYHIPLDTGIPATLKEKIWQNKYIDFKSLLPNMRSTPQYTVSLSDNLTPTLTLANRPPDPKHDLSLDQWTKAFLIYHFIYAQRHPAHTCQLVSYLSLVRTMASRGAQWRRYDEMFRKYREGAPDTPWDPPLLQLYMDAHYNNPSSSLSRPTSSASTPPNPPSDIPPGYCFRFHKENGQCRRVQCPFKHECFKCDGRHKATLCDSKSPSVSAVSRKR
ncbi:PREDICTED: uncharacterized protein LOC109464300 [Branchiostoma belcheri]|uniref:Uncharacterized protein LOC109464300 n=1 Tax=Branchiostoma belcheri TaxID=7741 RepID=A0A6P4YIG7_BRABE|nr:PREDICTED: uncharacterized protein LOC109464300 [Branchiostoma belcheri]